MSLLRFRRHQLKWINYEQTIVSLTRKTTEMETLNFIKNWNSEPLQIRNRGEVNALKKKMCFDSQAERSNITSFLLPPNKSTKHIRLCFWMHRQRVELRIIIIDLRRIKMTSA